jgi:hypothetical protein
MRAVTVGTVRGSNEAGSVESMGTQIRPSDEKRGLRLRRRTCSGMNTERRLEKMVEVFGDLDIQTRIHVLEDNILFGGDQYLGYHRLLVSKR